MADLKQIKVGDTTYNIEPYSSYYRSGCSSFEMNSGGSLLGYGGFIDFHFFNSSGKPLNSEGTVVSTTPDYTSRIIEDSAGRIAINGNTYITWSGLTSSSITSNGSVDASSARISNGLYVGTSITHHEGQNLHIGNGSNADYVWFVEDVAGGEQDGDSSWSIATDGGANFGSITEGGTALSNKYAPKAWINVSPSVSGLASASTTATGALAVGLGSTAGTHSVAIGESAVSTNNAVAIGKGAVADYSIAIGKDVSARAGSSVLIGGTVGGTGGVCVGYSSAAYSTYGAAIGYSSSAYGSYSLALGYGSQAGPSTSAASAYIAVGYNAKALGTASSLAVGKSAYSTSGSVVVGMSATGTGYISTVIGPSAQSIAAYGTAVGGSSKATGYYGTAVGYGANAAGSSSVAFGYSATGSGTYSVAIGYGSQATLCGAVAVGYSVEAVATGAIGIGYNATGSGCYGVAIGYNSSATATGAIGIGYSANTTAWNAIGIGYDTNAQGSYSTLIGYGSTASSSDAYAIGIGYFTTPQYNSIMIGNEMSEDGATIGSYSIAIGSAESSYIDSYESYNTPSPIETGLASIAIGSAFIYPDDDSSYYGCASALGEAAIAIGPDSNAYGENAISIGIGSSSKGYLSTAIGPFSDANASYSTSLGYGTHASGTHSVAVGAYARAYGKGIAIGYSVTAGNASYPTATTAASGAYAIAIGHNISAGVSGSRSLIKIGATGKNYYFYAGGSGWSSGSDERDKTDINPINNALTLIKEIQPITYRYNRRGDYSDNYSLLDYDVEAHKTGEKAEESVRAGFKAQDLARYFTANYNNECFNDIVQHDFETDPKTGKTADSYSVNYADLIPFMFQAIKEQQELIENQHQEIEDLKTTIDNILKRA